MCLRVGMGYDVHRLVKGRKLVLGGVTIPFEKGLDGHSDADVLTHAFCDALLGAAGLGDIGMHFPDSDPAYQGISSMILLEKVFGMVQDQDYRLVNADMTVLAEAPKLSLHRRRIQEGLARAAGVATDRISVKATTLEGLGSIGKGEGIGAMCTVLLMKKSMPGK